MKVSIITPSYNQGLFIERTILSVLEQGYPLLEYQILDGGSKDNTIEILRKYEQSLHWLSEKDKGQSDAINKGILATSGDIIGWLNSDDIYYPNTINTVVNFFREHPEVDVVYGKAHHIDIENKIIESYPTEPWNYERLKETCFLCQPAVFLRRNIVEKYGLVGPDLHYCMDYEYWLRLGKAGVKFAYLDRYLAGSRLYAETKTLGARKKVHAEINSMMLKLFNRVPDRWLFNYAHAVVEEKVARTEHPFLFIMSLALVSCYASLRWNKSISANMWSTLKLWLKNSWQRFTQRGKTA